MNIRKIQYTIDSLANGMTVQEFLKRERFSTHTIKLLKNNPYGILIKNKRVTVLKKLRTGDLLTLNIKDSSAALENKNIIPKNIPLAIVYEDKDIIVIDKPCKMPSHPSRNDYENTLTNALAYYFNQTKNECVIRVITRLDKDTSGLILVAKNAHASSILSDDVRHGKIDKQYLAVVLGEPKPVEGILDLPIARVSDSVIKRMVDFKRGVSARTHYKVLNSGEGLSLVKLWLLTGRTHQIRVHMSYIGCPVAGDWLYGGDAPNCGISRQALHCHSISFNHPITHCKLSFTSPPPDDMQTLINKIERGQKDETDGI